MIKINKIDSRPILGKGWLLDVKRIQAVLLKNGYDVTLDQADELWSDFSDSYSAEWLFLADYSDEEIFMHIKEFIL